MEKENPQGATLKKSLKERHMTMIALGGTIGTGLFVAGGETISTAGPGGALLSYALIGIMVYFLMTGLGEMSTWLPSSGSFGLYAARYVDKALGFALGWNYWFNWAITVAAELVAGALIMKYWFPGTPSVVWTAGFLAILFLLNFLSTRSYGESEFFFAGVKVITVIVFLAAGTLLIFGVGGHSPGFANWTIGDAPFVGGISAMLSVFMVAGFSFQGTEMLGVAAGEAECPEKSVPKAVHTIFWRILLFYLGAFTVIGFLIPYTDPNLLNASVENISISPFTLAFERFGLPNAASVMNLVILTAVLSAGNSGLYASTRMLYSLAREGKAPHCFLKINSRGVPVNALYATTAFGIFAFATSLVGDGTAYNWLVNISGMAGFITWVGIAAAYYRFRRAFIAQGRSLSELPYKAPFFPFGPLAALVLCLFIMAGQDTSLFSGTFEWTDFVAVYIGIPVFLLTYIWYKWKYHTHLIPLKEVDLSREDPILFTDRESGK